MCRLAAQGQWHAYLENGQEHKAGAEVECQPEHLDTHRQLAPEALSRRAHLRVSEAAQVQGEEVQEQQLVQKYAGDEEDEGAVVVLAHAVAHDWAVMVKFQHTPARETENAVCSYADVAQKEAHTLAIHPATSMLEAFGVVYLICNISSLKRAFSLRGNGLDCQTP